MGNITENRINVTIAATDMSTIQNNITGISALIPNLTLTDEQRSGELLSMDVDTKVFAEDAMNEIGISGAGIIPPFISAGNMKNDITLFEQCDVVEASLENLLQQVRDVKRIAADEVMTVANAIYKLYEMANAAGVPGGKQGYEKLKARYKKPGGNKQVDEPQ